MILEVETNTREIHDRLDARSLQLLGITNTRALEDEWRGQRATRDDDLLAGTEGTGLLLLGGTRINNAK
jgi:hypothetical protein